MSGNNDSQKEKVTLKTQLKLYKLMTVPTAIYGSET